MLPAWLLRDLCLFLCSIQQRDLIGYTYLPLGVRSLRLMLHEQYGMHSQKLRKIHSLLKENLIVFPRSELTKKMRSEILLLEIDETQGKLKKVKFLE